MACNSDKCHCPKCVHERRYVTAAQVDEIVERKVKAELDYRRSRAAAYRASMSLMENSAITKWVWRRVPTGWQRKSTLTGTLFGPVVKGRGPHTAEGRSFVKDTEGRVIEETVTLRAGELSKTTTKVFERPVESNIKQEETLLTPLKLSILLWRASHLSTTYPFAGDTLTPVRLTLREMEIEGLITFEGEEDYAYALTERARVLIKAILKLPLPVQKPTPWVMPS